MYQQTFVEMTDEEVIEKMSDRLKKIVNQTQRGIVTEGEAHTALVLLISDLLEWHREDVLKKECGQ